MIYQEESREQEIALIQQLQPSVRPQTSPSGASQQRQADFGGWRGGEKQSEQKICSLSAAMALREAANFSVRRFPAAAGRTSGVEGREGGVHAQDHDHARDSELALRSTAGVLGLWWAGVMRWEASAASCYIIMLYHHDNGSSAGLLFQA